MEIKIVNGWGKTLAAVESADTRDAIQTLVSEGADLTGADLMGADLRGATMPHFQICPQEGAFTAYKSVRSDEHNDVILTLEICTDAKRTSSLVGRKCRASAVKVLSASDGGTGPYHSKHDHGFTYTVGEVASVDNFDDDPRVECTSGLHFWMTKREAEEW